MAGLRAGIDVGGTFTDLVIVDEAGRSYTHKTLSTPDDPARGAAEGLAEALRRHNLQAADLELVVHGTTRVSNALIEGKGGTVALLTTEGTRDVLEQGREHRRRAEPVVGRVAPPEQPDQPADGQADVRDRVREPEHVERVRVAQQRLLELRLDVDPGPLLERHDLLRVLERLALALLVDDGLADEHVDGVEGQADRDLPGHREAGLTLAPHDREVSGISRAAAGATRDTSTLDGRRRPVDALGPPR